MSLQTVLAKSFNDYGRNFSAIFVCMLVFNGFIVLLAGLAGIPITLNTYKGVTNASIDFFSFSYIAPLVPLFIIQFIGIFLYLFIHAGLTASSVKKNLFSFNDLVSSAKSSYLAYLGLIVVTFIYIVGLTFLLIVPGIIFAVYWLFATFAFYDGHRSISSSLKRSRALIRGRWWKTLGYFLFLMLLLFGVGSIFSLFTLPASQAYLSSSDSSLLLVYYSLLGIIIIFMKNLLVVPFSVFFLKNMYLEWKSSEKKKSK